MPWAPRPIWSCTWQRSSDGDSPRMKIIGMDVGSTTVKAVVVEDGKATWQDYQRHNTRQAEKVHEFLERVETEAGGVAGGGRIFFSGSGARVAAPPCRGRPLPTGG